MTPPDGVRYWQPVDIIGLIIAVAITTLIVAAIIVPLITGKPLPGPVIAILDGLVDDMSSLLTLYVGATLQRFVDGRRGP